MKELPAITFRQRGPGHPDTLRTLLPTTIIFTLAVYLFELLGIAIVRQVLNPDDFSNLMDTAPISKWKQLPLKLKQLFRPAGDRNKNAIIRKRKLVDLLTRRLTVIKITLFVVGYLWMVLLPFPGLGGGTFMDENALQPAQVNTNWNWGDVHTADVYLEELERMRDANFTSEERGKYLSGEFAKLGISTATQSYTFRTSNGEINGTNAYAVLASPRHSGTEAMVISASWISRIGEGDGTLNMRGVSTILALASFLKRYSHWAKDIIFVVSDGYLDGMQAWLLAYHGSSQPSLQTQPLELTSGVIWTALNIDYPGHSFSHLGLFFEALNGRLPNQDLLNSVERIARYTAGIPVTIYDHLDPREESQVDLASWWLPSALYDIHEVKTYLYQAKNVARHLKYQFDGRGSGVHGLFRQFRIDAVTLFCVPATGPHGFHAIGRAVESTLRTMNNLLERLHASFFFYILTTSNQFLKIGLYLPSVILISVAIMFHGLSLWVDAAWVRETNPPVDPKEKGPLTEKPNWRQRQRPVLGALSIMAATHILGVLLFYVLSSSWFIKNHKAFSPLVFATIAAIPLLALNIPTRRSQDVAPMFLILKAANLCLTSTVISVVSLLNFSLAAALTILLGIPLLSTWSSSILPLRLLRYTPYACLGLAPLLFAQKQIVESIWSWQVLSVWFAPFVSVVYVPLVLQAGIACLLPP